MYLVAQLPHPEGMGSDSFSSFGGRILCLAAEKKKNREQFTVR
jgi:hypothetical protein